MDFEPFSGEPITPEQLGHHALFVLRLGAALLIVGIFAEFFW